MKRNRLFLITALLWITAATNSPAVSPVHQYRILALNANSETLQAFKQQGYLVTTAEAEKLSDPNFFNSRNFDCLAIMHTAIPKKAEKNFENFLFSGKDLIAANDGSITFPKYKIKNNWYLKNKDVSGFGKISEIKILPILYDSIEYRYRAAVKIDTYQHQDIIKNKSIKIETDGLSAVGFEYARQSTYVPLLQVKDSLGRRIGFAGGVLIHYDGQFKNGNWFIFGAANRGFYKSKIFTESLTEAIEKLRDGCYAEKFYKENIDSVKKRLKKTPHNIQPLKISANGSFVYPDGSKFFMLGVNYMGSFDRKCQQASEEFDISYWEKDFKKAAKVGINCMRLWIEGINCRIDRLESIIELANRYEIYLLLHPTAHPPSDGKKLEKMFTCLAKAVKDEPIVIGFDLMNEPLITNVGSVRIDGKISPAAALDVYAYPKLNFDHKWVEKMAEQRPGWPELGRWISDSEAKNLYALHNSFSNYYQKYFLPMDYSTIAAKSWPIPIEPQFKAARTAVDKTFANWIGLHKKIIKKYCPDKFITVGYNTVLATLEANSELDFVSHHIYQPPSSFKDFQKSVTTFDRLKKSWPTKPISMGEFGYSCGVPKNGGKPLDIYTASVAEMIIYLYAFANDYSGAMSWLLSNWPIPIMDLGGPWIAKENKKYEAGFGMFYYDGTTNGRAKPIVSAVKNLSRYIKNHRPGTGNFELIHQQNSIGCGYVYKNKGTLFVGANKYQGPLVSFNSPKPVNLMLQWVKGSLNILATGDLEVTLSPKVIGIEKNYSLIGKYGKMLKQQNNIKILLLEGESVIIKQ